MDIHPKGINNDLMLWILISPSLVVISAHRKSTAWNKDHTLFIDFA
jgi:hypothetical protein